MMNTSDLVENKKREDNIIRDNKITLSFYTSKKERDGNTIKSRRNVFKLKKENEAIKGRIIRNI